MRFSLPSKAASDAKRKPEIAPRGTRVKLEQQRFMAGNPPHLLPTPLIVFLTLAGCRIAWAQTGSGTPTERFILDKLAAGQVADLLTRPDKERVVNATFVEQILTGQNSSGKIHWRGVQIVGAIIRERVNLRGAEIPYRVLLTKSRFNGGIDCAESHFLKLLDLSDSHFADAEFSNTRVEGESKFNGATFESADFDFASLAGSLEMSGVAFNGARTSFNTVQVGGNAAFQNASFKHAVDFRGAEFSRYAMFDGAHFQNKADFNNTKVKGAATFVNAVFNSSAVFLGVEIAGELNFQGAHFNSTKDDADLTNMKVERNVLLVKTVFAAPVSFFFTRVGIQLGMQDVTFENDVRLNSIVTHELFIRNVEFKKKVSIKDADVEILYLDMPKPPASLEMDHLKYAEVGSDADKMLPWVEKAGYSRDNYARLETFFASHGNPGKADEVFVQMKRRERREKLRSLRWCSDLVLDWLVKYGRAPERAAYPSLLVVLFGCFVFRNHKRMQGQRSEDSHARYSPFWYSLDLFAPGIDLQAAKVWTPREDWGFGRNYARVHRILGWILVPIWLAAATGLIK
jgi:uncharacterized protein YjbI with pentapeptide repeats